MEMSVILAAGRKSEGILGAHGDKSVKKSSQVIYVQDILLLAVPTSPHWCFL